MITKLIGSKRAAALYAMIAGAELSAGTITYGPLGSTAVPVSHEALLVMAGIFLIAGSWMLFRSRRGMGSALLLTALIAGVYPLDGEAMMGGEIVELNNPDGGTVSFDEIDEYITVINTTDVPLVIKNIQPDSGVAIANQCTIGMQLDPEAMCNLHYPAVP